MQDQNERRDIRYQYRTLLEQTSKNKDELINPESEKLHETLMEADRIFGRVTRPREAALDSQLIAVLAEMGRQQAHQLQTEFVVFNPIEFTAKLTTFLHQGGLQSNRNGNEPHITGEMWDMLGSIAQPCFKKTPTLHYMYGAFERGPPKQKPIRAREPKDREVRGKTVPKQMTNMQEQERREATTAEVENIYSILVLYYNEWKKMPICFFEFVCNPCSYGQTVENIFYVSFLVRDGHAHVFLDDEGLPVIEPVQHEDSDNVDRANVKRNQVVVTITKADWKSIIETFKIKEPLIRTRNHGDQ